MEDVWKDLSLSSVHHPTNTRSSISGFYQLGLSFQDFLSNTPAKETSKDSYTAAGLFGSPSSSTTPEPWLSLNSTTRDQLSNVERSQPYGQGHHHHLGNKEPRTSGVEFQVLKKRVIESDDVIKEKKQRLIKSRDSADRCRGKKLAYTQELEIKLQRLKKENAELKKQLQKMQIILPKKVKLQRTLTAPF